MVVEGREDHPEPALPHNAVLPQKYPVARAGAFTFAPKPFVGASKARRESQDDTSIAAKAILAIEKGWKGTASCKTMASLADALAVPRGWLAFGG